jgi:hypothetical protein
MEAMEKIVYEVKPYACVALAFFALQIADVNSAMGKLAALTLLVLGSILVYARLRGRGIIKW